MTGWQPIDTAPHDGTTVWVLCKWHYSNLCPFRTVELAVWSTMDCSWFCPYRRTAIAGQRTTDMFTLAWCQFEKPALPPKDQFVTP